MRELQQKALEMAETVEYGAKELIARVILMAKSEALWEVIGNRENPALSHLCYRAREYDRAAEWMGKPEGEIA